MCKKLIFNDFYAIASGRAAKETEKVSKLTAVRGLCKANNRQTSERCT